MSSIQTYRMTIEFDTEVDDTDDYVSECVAELEDEIGKWELYPCLRARLHAILVDMMEQYYDLRQAEVLVAVD